jgi:hypothetical protein
MENPRQEFPQPTRKVGGERHAMSDPLLVLWTGGGRFLFFISFSQLWF